jgi:hypothetical protein
MCLQSILEGKGVFLKKIGKFVEPTPGFNIIATANTKGKGSDGGMFIGTNVLNEAFLERFCVTFEQKYPTSQTETKILVKVATSLGLDSEEKFCGWLADWADLIRKTFYEGAIDEVISTRRLVHIIRAYAIFGNKLKAIKYCINRYDEAIKISFLQFYNTVDAEIDIAQQEDSGA